MATPIPTPVPPPAPNRTFLYVSLVFAGLFFISLFFLVFALRHALRSTGMEPFLASGGDISLVELEGPITQSDDLVRLLKHFRKGSEKALLLRINSPGGVVAPSQEIYSEILRARKDNKIIVASMSSLAASGAYYIASACDKIVANPGTLTGSIGVIFELPEASGLMKKVGVELQTVKSGKFKDTGSLGRPLNPADRAYIQGTVDEVYNQFLDAVIDGRRDAFQEKLAKKLGKKAKDVTDQEIRNYLLPYADGRVVTGQKAYELGMVDELGNYEDAVALTAELAGIKGEPTVKYDRPSRVEQWLKSLTPFSALSATLNEGYLLEYKAF